MLNARKNGQIMHNPNEENHSQLNLKIAFGPTDGCKALYLTVLLVLGLNHKSWVSYDSLDVSLH